MSATPERIGEMYLEAKRYLKFNPYDPGCRDTAIIARMLIRTDQEGDEQRKYTCKHLGADGLCGIYDRRPKMCREYPYGGACDQCGIRNPNFVKELPVLTARASG
jgi:Fe-S-cluster containining protein